MNTLSQKPTTQQMLDDLSRLDTWTEEPTVARNAIPASPETIRRLLDLAIEQGVTTEEIVSRALAALEAQSIR